MPHMHDKIDCTVAIFVVQQAQVLISATHEHIGMIYFARPQQRLKFLYTLGSLYGASGLLLHAVLLPGATL